MILERKQKQNVASNVAPEWVATHFGAMSLAILLSLHKQLRTAAIHSKRRRFRCHSNINAALLYELLIFNGTTSLILFKLVETTVWVAQTPVTRNAQVVTLDSTKHPTPLPIVQVPFQDISITSQNIFLRTVCNNQRRQHRSKFSL